MPVASSLATSDLIEVTTTVATLEQARLLASGLLQARLAACVQITAMESHYRWQGRAHQDPEHQLRLKTRSDRFAAIGTWLEQHHPYALPQLLASKIDAGSPAYMAWLQAQLDE